MLTEKFTGYDEVGDNLNKAADYMNEHGHVRGTLMDDYGAVCVYGSLHCAIYGEIRSDTHPDDPMMHKCSTKLREQLKSMNIGDYSIVGYNDIIANKKEAMELLRGAAERCRVPLL